MTSSEPPFQSAVCGSWGNPRVHLPGPPRSVSLVRPFYPQCPPTAGISQSILPSITYQYNVAFLLSFKENFHSWHSLFIILVNLKTPDYVFLLL